MSLSWKEKQRKLKKKKRFELGYGKGNMKKLKKNSRLRGWKSNKEKREN